jgi:hypothetical protein
LHYLTNNFRPGVCPLAQGIAQRHGALGGNAYEQAPAGLWIEQYLLSRIIYLPIPLYRLRRSGVGSMHGAGNTFAQLLQGAVQHR